MSAPESGTPITSGLLALPASIFRRVWRDASWSLAGNLLTVVSGLATLKIIGRFVSTAEYGTASLVLGVCALLIQFIAGPLLSERIRLYFDHLRSGDTRPLSKAIEGLLLRTSGIVAALYLATAGVFYLRGEATYLQMWLPALLLILVQPQLSAAFGQLEAHRDYRGLSFAQPAVNVLQVPALLALLWLAIGGAAAIVLAQAVAALLVFAGVQAKARRVPALPSPESTLGRATLTGFTWSLYAFNLSSWIMATSDRYLIDHFVNRSEVGIYVINYAFWAIPYTVLNGWINSFSRPRLYARAADQSWDRVFRVVLGTLSAGAAFAVLGTGLIYLVGKPLALRVMGERFWHSEQLMMLLAAAHIFFVVGHTASTYFLALKRAHFVWISCLIAAAGNIVANIILLPKWGFIAAAYTTLGAYALWATLMVGGIFLWSGRMQRLSQRQV